MRTRNRFVEAVDRVIMFPGWAYCAGLWWHYPFTSPAWVAWQRAEQRRRDDEARDGWSAPTQPKIDLSGSRRTS
jgi:hypothetical protein